ADHASAPAAQAPTRLIATPPAQSSERSGPVAQPAAGAGKGAMPPSPSARKLMEESGVSSEEVAGSGRRGQILKEDVLAVPARAAAAARPRGGGAPAPPPRRTPRPAAHPP